MLRSSEQVSQNVSDPASMRVGRANRADLIEELDALLLRREMSEMD